MQCTLRELARSHRQFFGKKRIMTADVDDVVLLTTSVLLNELYWTGGSRFLQGQILCNSKPRITISSVETGTAAHHTIELISPSP